jgi:S-DNA-T family DNA segregation ATPase FtsK/SpoIIIE
MPASARRAPRKRARRTSASWRDQLPVLEQRHWDLIGLGLVALALFLAFLVYLGRDGGEGGGAIVRALRALVGAVIYAVPPAVLATGALIVLRPVLPAVRPFRAAAGCLFVAATLGLAAGTLGLGGASDRVQDRGGYVGDGLDRLIGGLLGAVGAHIVVVFCFIAGVLLLTGASVASIMRATHSTVSESSRRLREGTTEMRTAVASRRRTPREELDDLEDAAAVQVTRTRTRAKAKAADKGKDEFWSGEERFPDLYGGDPRDRPTEDVPVVQDPLPEPAAGEDLLDRDHAPAWEEPTVVQPAARAPEPVVEPEPDPEPEPAPVPALELEPVEDEAGPRLAEDPDTDEPGVLRTAVRPEDLTPQGRLRASVTDSPDFQWALPDARFLKRSDAEANRPDHAGQQKVADQLLEALGHFGIKAQVVGMVAGPHITRYELRLAPGIKVAKVAQLKDDLAYALAAADIRILAPIPGKQAVGVEVPNARRRMVHLGDVMQQTPEGWSPLTVWLGKDVAGRAIGADLAKMPHLLVAGTTGAGKSACVNAMLTSVLLRATPHEVRLLLVDPKQVELTHYESIPHLLTPVITSPKKAAVALQNLVREMEQRYSYMALARARNLVGLNEIRARRGEAPLPYILCIIDELADLMMVASSDVEDSIIRIAQKARAVGIHMVLATQSPRVDVITGLIKANVPSRIAFAVSSQTDSRVILDQNGAEALLGQGDMLFSAVGSSTLQRIQGAYIDEPQIEALTDQWREQGEPEFREELLEEVEEEAVESGGGEDGFDPDEDPLLGDAIRLVAEMQTASTSMLQRRLRLGYTRAGRLIDMLERRGVISGYEGSKPRQVLVSESDVPRVLASLEERGELVSIPDDDEPAAPPEP